MEEVNLQSNTRGFITVLELSIRYMEAACQHIRRTGKWTSSEKRRDGNAEAVEVCQAQKSAGGVMNQ